MKFMKQEKIRYFLVEDEYYVIPYNKFIKGVKLIGEDTYTSKLNRYVYFWDNKIWKQERQQVLLRKIRTDDKANIVFLSVKGEHIGSKK